MCILKAHIMTYVLLILKMKAKNCKHPSDNRKIQHMCVISTCTTEKFLLLCVFSCMMRKTENIKFNCLFACLPTTLRVKNIDMGGYFVTWHSYCWYRPTHTWGNWKIIKNCLNYLKSDRLPVQNLAFERIESPNSSPDWKIKINCEWGRDLYTYFWIF